MHKFRAEHWIVVGGKASVEIDSKVFFLRGESKYLYTTGINT